MSEYIVIQSEYTNAECIKLALEELGYVYEEHKVAQGLYGYAGDIRQQKAHIIVRRKHVGRAANDVGFRKKSDGKYELIISEYDRRAGSKTANDFLHKLTPCYNKHIVMKRIKKLGAMVVSNKVTKDGKIKIKARRR